MTRTRGEAVSVPHFACRAGLARRCLQRTISATKDESRGVPPFICRLPRSNTITVDELRSALENPAYRISREQIQDLLEAADLDGDRKIDWKEFLAATVDKVKMTRQERLQYVFSLFDTGAVRELPCCNSVSGVVGRPCLVRPSLA